MATSQARRQRKAEQARLRKLQRRSGAADRNSPGAASRPEARGRSPSLDPRAVDLLEAFDGFAPFRNGIRRVAELKEEWAGIPMPLTGQRLVIEPKYPRAEALSDVGQEDKPPVPPEEAITIRNVWWSRQKQANIWVYEDAAGKIGHVVQHNQRRRLDLDIGTMQASVAWGIEQEAHAVQTLGTLLRHHMFKSYLLTGMFLETSQRSGLTYLFRRLKPTVALDARDQTARHIRVLAALCLHPIAFYEDTWAGAMCPTDDVIAHLMLMRGDEVMFWRRSNQHAPWEPQAAL